MCACLFHSLLDPTSWQHEASALGTTRRFSTFVGKWPRSTRVIANKLLQRMCSEEWSLNRHQLFDVHNIVFLYGQLWPLPC